MAELESAANGNEISATASRSCLNENLSAKPSHLQFLKDSIARRTPKVAECPPSKSIEHCKGDLSCHYARIDLGRG